MKKKTGTAVLITGMILLGILSFGLFYSASRNYLRSICNSELEDYAKANASTIKSDLENALKLLQAASESFSEMDENSSAEAKQLLRILAHDSPFESMVLTDMEGRGISSAGGAADAAEYVGFQRILYGESRIDTMDLNGDGTLEIMVGAPLISGGRVRGGLFGIYQTFGISRHLNVTSFNGQGYAVLVDAAGNIVVPDTSPYCLNTKDENYWQFFKQVDFERGYSYEALMKNVREKKSGIAAYTLASEQRELYYTPLGMNDWYLLQMVTGDVINSYTGPMTRLVVLLMLQFAALSALIAFLIHRRIEAGRKEKLLEAERFHTLSENIPGGVAEFAVGETSVLVYANEGFFRMVGYSRKEFFSEPIRGDVLLILADGSKEAVLSRFREQVSRGSNIYLEYSIRQKSGEVRWLSMSGTVIHKAQERSLMQTLVTDITVQKQSTAELMETARRDKMTHLYDKVSIAELVASETGQIQPGRMDALLVLDIDNFKQVNDTYGHQVGDIAIIKIADTIHETFRCADLKGRIGGDEFMVLMRDVTDLVHARERVNQFLENVRELELAGETHRLSCSVGGVAVLMKTPHTYEELFQQADQNLYRVKRTGKGQAYIQAFREERVGKEQGS